MELKKNTKECRELRAHKKRTTSEDAAKHYEIEARKEKLLGECSGSRAEEALHKAKAQRLERIASNIRRLFCRSRYHTAALNCSKFYDQGNF